MPVVCGPFTTLESLDAVGGIDSLGFSLDDPLWDSNFCVVIDDGGYVTSGQQCGPFTLEELNYFGDLDSLPYSLDDEIWTRDDVCVIYAIIQNVTGTAAVGSFGNVTFGGVATVTCSADVISNAIRYRTTTGAIDVTASVSSLANIIVTSSGSILGQATVSADSIRIRTTSGAVNGIASVSAMAYATYDGSGAINGSGSVSANGVRYRISSGKINSASSVSADGIRYRMATGSVTATGTVTGLGGVIYGGFADVNAIATVTALPNAIFSAKGAITSAASMSGFGSKLGENWTVPTAPTDPNWQTPTPPTDNWTPVVTTPVLGDFYKGGYFVGTISYNNATYDLVMSPIANEISTSRWEEVYNFFGLSDFDGVNNNAVLIEKNRNTGIAKQISVTTINNYKDWYFPSKDELTVMVNGSRGFTKNLTQRLTGRGYWSSTNKPSYSSAIKGWIYYVWAYDFTGDAPALFNPPPNGTGTFGFKVRPIRRIKR